jgi:hypothetical protein
VVAEEGNDVGMVTESVDQSSDTAVVAAHGGTASGPLNGRYLESTSHPADEEPRKFVAKNRAEVARSQPV